MFVVLVAGDSCRYVGNEAKVDGAEGYAGGAIEVVAGLGDNPQGNAAKDEKNDGGNGRSTTISAWIGPSLKTSVESIHRSTYMEKEIRQITAAFTV